MEDLIQPRAPLEKQLLELSQRMEEMTPERRRRLVEQLERSDAEIVRKLKVFHGHRCQFPACGVRIRKRTGGYYVEVAHIDPLHRGGKSVVPNLLVLCPNHHKEWDFGDRRISEHTHRYIAGTLNGIEFRMNLSTRRAE